MQLPPQGEYPFFVGHSPVTVVVVPVAGTVRRAIYVGPSIEYAIDTPLGPLFAVCRETDRAFAAGDAVSIGILPRGVALLPPAG